MINKSNEIMEEVNKVILGKEKVVEAVMTAILAGGHILLNDIPGVGKTTLALAFSKAMGLDFKRIQFTPDVVPSDITGFTMLSKDTGTFVYSKGAVICNFFLADEINRTSSKTQSALLEVMEEGFVTVDGISHEVGSPFIVMATQNPMGTIGTQNLPEAQLDRFMIEISMGYPDYRSQIEILKDRRIENPLNNINACIHKTEIEAMKKEVKEVYVDDKIYEYIASLAEATRNHEYIRLGLSPRGALALTIMAKSRAFIENRDYVIPKDVTHFFRDVVAHRIIESPKAKPAKISINNILKEIILDTKEPDIDR